MIAVRSLLIFSAGILALAIAVRLLLAFGSERIVRGVGINRVAFWLVLAAGAIWLLVRLVKFFAVR